MRQIEEGTWRGKDTLPEIDKERIDAIVHIQWSHRFVELRWIAQLKLSMIHQCEDIIITTRRRVLIETYGVKIWLGPSRNGLFQRCDDALGRARTGRAVVITINST